MAINWNEYELVLEATDSKNCEVTSRDMGGVAVHSCPISKMKAGEQVPWEPSYDGYESVKVVFLGAGEAVHLCLYNGYEFNKDLRPGETWESGWYSFGSWDYHVALKLQKKTEKQDDQN